jgi:hypothetical protein
MYHLAGFERTTSQRNLIWFLGTPFLLFSIVAQNLFVSFVNLRAMIMILATPGHAK